MISLLKKVQFFSFDQSNNSDAIYVKVNVLVLGKKTSFKMLGLSLFSIAQTKTQIISEFDHFISRFNNFFNYIELKIQNLQLSLMTLVSDKNHVG